MRTTIRLDDELLREAKRIAAESDKTLAEVIEDALRESLARRKPSNQSKDFRLPTFRGHGLQPGLTWDDLNCNARMLEIMEESEHPGHQRADS